MKFLTLLTFLFIGEAHADINIEKHISCLRTIRQSYPETSTGAGADLGEVLWNSNKTGFYRLTANDIQFTYTGEILPAVAHTTELTHARIDFPESGVTVFYNSADAARGSYVDGNEGLSLMSFVPTRARGGAYDSKSHFVSRVNDETRAYVREEIRRRLNDVFYHIAAVQDSKTQVQQLKLEMANFLKKRSQENRGAMNARELAVFNETMGQYKRRIDALESKSNQKELQEQVVQWIGRLKSACKTGEFTQELAELDKYLPRTAEEPSGTEGRKK